MRLPHRIRFLLALALLLTGAFAAFAQDDNHPSDYTIETGDSLDSISARFDIQPQCLADANEITRSTLLRPGQVLVLDYDCPRYDGVDFVTFPREDINANVVSPSSDDAGQGGGGGSGSDNTYIVERGDTLDTIGQKLNISSVAIAVANDIGPRDKIFIGQELVIPPDAPAYGQFPALTNPDNFNSSDQDLGQGGGGPSVGPGDTLYIVQPLDVLDRVAAANNVQTGCMADANGLTNPSLIFPGQSLVIPGNCPPYDGADTVGTPEDVTPTPESSNG